MRLLLALLLLLPLQAAAQPGAPHPVEEVLDAFHRAAAEGDFDAYFERMTGDAVFLGSDASERWQGQAFRDFARPHFDKGGWTYTVRERELAVDAQRGVAWFDELLDNARYGVFRGSGVLLLQDGHWRIAQYNLSYPVPNALLPGLAQQIDPAVPAAAPAEVARDVELEEQEQAPSDQCRRKRHKTNTRAGC